VLSHQRLVYHAAGRGTSLQGIDVKDFVAMISSPLQMVHHKFLKKFDFLVNFEVHHFIDLPGRS
jgi:hypothetical protein